MTDRPSQLAQGEVVMAGTALHTTLKRPEVHRWMAAPRPHRKALANLAHLSGSRRAQCRSGSQSCQMGSRPAWCCCFQGWLGRQCLQGVGGVHPLVGLPLHSGATSAGESARKLHRT